MRRSAFTLVELLVSLAVIGLLMALLFPAVQAARSAARDAECRHNLHEMGVDLHSRMGRHEEIPDFTAGPHRFNCPEYVAQYGNNGGSYTQICAHDRRYRLLEHYGVPSERIVAIYELYSVHRNGRYAVFLDGHVAAIADSDVGYEEL